MDWLRALLQSDSLSPHGICLLWRPELIWTHVVSDAFIASAYLSIPLALGMLVRRRGDIAFGWIFWCFVTFILACGTTHVLSIVTLWVPVYGIEAIVKVVTAMASVATAVALWPLLPRVLALPSPKMLKAANDALTERIGERDCAMRALQCATDERLRAEDMLRQSQKMEAIGHLTGGVAHDFNNLLNVIVANLERVERKLPDDSEHLPPVRNAMAGAERAAAITHQLLAFARRQPLRPVDTDVGALLIGMADLLQGAVTSRVIVNMAFEADLWPVRVDPNQLENAILNLAVNARDAMENTPECRLDITGENVSASEAVERDAALDAGRDYVLVEMADTGLGMPDHVAAQAFEPFFTTKPLGQGTGLGLSQVFGFAKQSGGHASIVSAPGRGTRIRLFLPRSEADKTGTPTQRVGSPRQLEGAEA